MSQWLGIGSIWMNARLCQPTSVAHQQMSSAEEHYRGTDRRRFQVENMSRRRRHFVRRQRTLFQHQVEMILSRRFEWSGRTPPSLIRSTPKQDDRLLLWTHAHNRVSELRYNRAAATLSITLLREVKYSEGSDAYTCYVISLCASWSWPNAA